MTRPPYSELKPGRAACFWKVDIENDLGDHVYQGIVILAGIVLGYKVHRIGGSLGARIGKWVGGTNNMRTPKQPSKLIVIRESSGHCPGLVAMR